MLDFRIPLFIIYHLTHNLMVKLIDDVFAFSHHILLSSILYLVYFQIGFQILTLQKPMYQPFLLFLKVVLCRTLGLGIILEKLFHILFQPKA